jgi:hypothetical protein
MDVPSGLMLVAAGLVGGTISSLVGGAAIGALLTAAFAWRYWL